MKILDYFKIVKKFRKCFYYNKLFFWSSILISLMIFLPFGNTGLYNPDSNLGASRIFRVICFGLFSVYILFYSTRHNVFPKKTSFYAFLIYVLICFVSTLYSPNPIETFWKSFEILILFLIALLIKNEMKLKKIDSNMIFSGITYMALVGVVFSIIGYIIFPDIALNIANDFLYVDSLRPVWGIIPAINPNSLGQFSTMISFVGLYNFLYLKKDNKGFFILIVIGIVGQFLAYSRTSIIAFILISLFLFIRNKKSYIILLIFPIISFIYYFQNQILLYISRGQETDQLLTLTGRTFMWAKGWESFLSNPIYGLGYYSGHKKLNIEIGMDYSSLDNTFLEILVDVGILGFVFIFFFVFKALITNYRLLFINNKGHQSTWTWVSFGFLCIMIIRSMTGPSFQSFHINLYFLFLIVITQEYLQNLKTKYPTNINLNT